MAKAKTLAKITVYLMPSPAGLAVKEALDNSFSDAQSNARRWLALGMFAERAGFRLDDNELTQSQTIASAPQHVIKVLSSSPTTSTPAVTPPHTSPLGVTFAVSKLSVQADPVDMVSKLPDTLRNNLRNL